MKFFRNIIWEKLTIPRITCKDGFSISVQANKNAYCEPRRDFGPYTHVECGFPSARPNEKLLQYAENKNDPQNTVYGYVPINIVEKLIEEHGGIEEK